MKKMIILFSVFLTTTISNILAQADGLFTINPGEKLVQAIPDSAQYFSKNFIKGLAWFVDGRTGAVMLNYNYLYDEMLFINEKGDTLAIANPLEFKRFVIDQDTFCYADNKYFHKLGTYGGLELAERTFFGIADIKKIGAMGVETSGVSIDQFKEIPQNGVGTKDLVMQEKTIMKKVSNYYISDKNGVYRLATKKNVQKAATENRRAQLEKYLTSNSVNYFKKEDLVKLLTAIQ
ncbi:MAG: hypothetical protein JST17_08490 [Bacteroidetes bacterium]|nr:hypothetical protein [Bacteroidota bacterium]MBS1930786.1 hypothetical protein [Bacteroidota bacterium]